MRDEKTESHDLSASVTGILECLRMLAEEAAELQLDDTMRALQRAIQVCQTERKRGDMPEQARELPPPGAVLH